VLGEQFCDADLFAGFCEQSLSERLHGVTTLPADDAWTLVHTS
jgi:hypothetical protein